MARERRVAGPARGERPAGHEHRGGEHHARDRQQPVRQRVQARERHVGRAEHQRDDVVPDPGEDRDDEQEDHQRRVHGHETVEGLRVHVLHARLRELGAEHERQEPAEDEEGEGRADVLDPDHLVIGVDAEVVLPALGAVAGVVLGLRRLADGVAEPVVEPADAGEEPERDRDEADRRDHRPVPDRVPALERADRDHDQRAEAEEERDRPQAADVSRREQPVDPTRR